MAIKQNAAQYFKPANNFKPNSNHFPHFQSVDWQARCPVQLKVRFQHFCNNTTTIYEMDIHAKLGTLPILTEQWENGRANFIASEF
jgi:hypothetical protein